MTVANGAYGRGESGYSIGFHSNQLAFGGLPEGFLLAPIVYDRQAEMTLIKAIVGS